MGADRALKLAESLLESDLTSENFEVEVLTRDESTAVAEALRDLGCGVEIDPFKPRFTVTRPQRV